MNYNFGKILSALSNKLDRDLNNISKNVGIITSYNFSETDFHLTINNEILCQFSYEELDINNSIKTITLAKPLLDTHYNVVFINTENVVVYDKTTTSFKIKLLETNGYEKIKFSWCLWGVLG